MWGCTECDTTRYDTSQATMRCDAISQVILWPRLHLIYPGCGFARSATKRMALTASLVNMLW